MKKYGLLTALAALLALRAAPAVLASDGSTFSSTPNSGDSLFGYHVYGTDNYSRGFIWDYNDTTTSNLGWSMGLEKGFGDLYLFNYNYLNAGTLTPSNTYFWRMRGDNGQLELGPNAPHPTSGVQVNITAGTSGAPRSGLGVGLWGNGNWLYLYQNQTSPAIRRTQINFANTYQMGTDSGYNNTADWWLFNTGTGHIMMTANPDDSLTVKYGFSHQGSTLGFYGATPITKPVITGDRNDGTALHNLPQALQSMGLITDQSTP